MKTLAAMAIVLCAVSMRAADEALPAGAGAGVLQSACVQCHDFRWIVSQRKTAAAWRRTVDEMIWRGAPLMPGEADVVTQYLASSFGAPAADAALLPAGPGHDLVAGACVQCHDLGVTTAQHKSDKAWQQTVERMVRLGAHLSSADVPVVVQYLTHAFGPEK